MRPEWMWGMTKTACVFVMGSVSVTMVWLFKESVREQMFWGWLLVLLGLAFTGMALTWSVAGGPGSKPHCVHQCPDHKQGSGA